MDNADNSPIVHIGGNAGGNDYGFKIDSSFDSGLTKYTHSIKAFDRGSISFKNVINARSIASANSFFVDMPNTIFEGVYQNNSNLYSSSNVVFNSGAGTSPTLTSITGGQNFVIIEFVTGTSPSATSSVFIVSLPVSFTSNAVVVPSAMNSNSATQMTNFCINGTVTTSFNLYVSTALPASTTFILGFMMIGFKS
jgi:hypothetical protein